MFSFFSSDKPENPKIEFYDGPSNPLPPCPKTPNCVRRSYKIISEPHRVFTLALEVFRVMGAHIEQQSAADYRMHGVYPIAFFNDDVHIRIEDSSGYSVLHIRSASRTGTYDFGVNRRRVNRFIQKLGERL